MNSNVDDFYRKRGGCETESSSNAQSFGKKVINAIFTTTTIFKEEFANDNLNIFHFNSLTCLE